MKVNAFWRILESSFWLDPISKVKATKSGTRAEIPGKVNSIKSSKISKALIASSSKPFARQLRMTLIKGGKSWEKVFWKRKVDINWWN